MRLQMLQLLNMIANPESVFGRKLWPGCWKGRVEDVQDPEMRGRMKVRIPAVHTDKGAVVPVDHLPWAEPCVQDAGANYGDFHVPYRLGDWVWVMFEGGNPDYPIWLGSWFGNFDTGGTSKSEVPEECQNSKYPHRRIFKSRRGHKIELSDEKGDLEIKITDVKGNFIWMDTETDTLKIYWNGNKEEIITGNSTVRIDGDLKTLVKGVFNEEIQGDHTSKIGGQESVVVSSTMNHVASTINHNSGGSAPSVPPLPDPADTVQERKPAFPDRINNYPQDDAVMRKTGGAQTGLTDASSPVDEGGEP